MTIALSAVAVLIGLVALFRAVIHRAYRIPRREERGSPADLGFSFREVLIPTSSDKRLYGWFVPAAVTGPAPVVAILHGWGGNAEAMLPFVPLFHGAGFACLLVDARNHGRSDADGISSLPQFAEDLDHAFRWLANQPEVDARRRVLLGHSVGAAAALLVASRRDDVAAVVSIASFAHPVELMRRQMRAHRIPYVPIGWLVLRYIEHAIGASFDDIAPRHTIRRVRCPVLLVHGGSDRRVPFTDAEAILASGSHAGAELLRLPETEHGSAEGVERHGADVIAFLRRAFKGSD